MHLELLVEEPSAEAALSELLPKIVGVQVTWAIHVHQGKRDLLTKLPNRLRAYARWLPRDWAIVVLVDEDREDCLELKGLLQHSAEGAGLSTTARPGPGHSIQVVNRIAVEELEAWFFGDVEALRNAYPGVPATLAGKSKYRDPDAITGGTWEALERVLQRAGYFRGGLAKIEAARCIARVMEPSRNRSRSFCCFRDALAALPSSQSPSRPSDKGNGQ
ncbi:MAG: DUF4276 family protein [Planctomycetes bacterium]|nr:DUF4276 family protein [Planctomycetota bacterium]